MTTEEKNKVMVMVVPESFLEQLGGFTDHFAEPPDRLVVNPAIPRQTYGFCRNVSPDDSERKLKKLAAACTFMPRGDAETDVKFKQVIPYVTFAHESFIYRYTRGVAGDEARLHGKMSVGFGGHVEQSDDADPADRLVALTNGLAREMAEEVMIGAAGFNVHAGFVYDPTTPVGAVHLGVSFMYQLQAPLLITVDPGASYGLFCDPRICRNRLDAMEDWSKHVLGNILTSFNIDPKTGESNQTIVTPPRDKRLFTGRN